VSDPQSEFVKRHAPEGEQYVARGPKGDRGDRGEQGARGLTSRTARSIVALFLLAFILAGSALLITSQEIAANNAKWCTAMVLLTKHPVPEPADPAKNPSRVQTYQLYTTFRTLRRQLGCG
jgi:hypothetical protein